MINCATSVHVRIPDMHIDIRRCICICSMYSTVGNVFTARAPISIDFQSDFQMALTLCHPVCCSWEFTHCISIYHFQLYYILIFSLNSHIHTIWSTIAILYKNCMYCTYTSITVCACNVCIQCVPWILHACLLHI